MEDESAKAKKQALEDAKTRGAAKAVMTMANTAEAYVSTVQVGPEANAHRVGPKTVGKQAPVPAYASPYAGLKCSKCGSRDVAGFVVSGKFTPPPAARTMQESADDIERHLAESVYGNVSSQDVALVTEFGLPLEHLSPGLVGRGKPAAASQVPVAKGVPMCLRHLNEALTVPEVPVKPSVTPGVDALDRSRNWKELASDPTFVNVTDGKISALITRAQWNARLNGEL